MRKFWELVVLSIFTSCHVMALEQSDREAIEAVISGYADAWNMHAGKGFGDGFTEDADFVNIIGMAFKGKGEIEERHIQILNSFLKGTSMSIESIVMREVKPEVVTALVRWKLEGYTPSSNSHLPGIKEGIFTQVFIRTSDKWEITASQNTLKCKP